MRSFCPRQGPSLLHTARRRRRQVIVTRFASSKSDVDTSRPATRTKDATKIKENEYVTIREKYNAPKYPIVLAHGLLGFDELRLFGSHFPGVQYWRGIKEAFQANGVSVITAAVGPMDSIEQRAEALASYISSQAPRMPSNSPSSSYSSASEGEDGGAGVNIIAHSMGGLDSRHMITHLLGKKYPDVRVRSLTTIATPHRGSAFADHVFDQIGPARLPLIYRAMDRLGVPTGAWSQLTRRHMCHGFNPRTPDVDGVRYFSYGADFSPRFWSAFYYSHRVIGQLEGPNDGLVSVDSSRWGEYKGTIDNVSHLDLINWTNRLKWMLWELSGHKRNFNAVAFYLNIADMLAKEGL